jgi:hypothetical protein
MVLVSEATPDDCRAAAELRNDAADRYRPQRVRLLLIAQMPPDELDRYFYFATVPTADYLFQAVVPHLLGEQPARLDKREQLAALRDQGVFLIDLKPDPCDDQPIQAFVADLVKRATKLAPEHAILVKVDVYDAAFQALREAAIPVVDERIPFPSTGQQKQFARKFRNALVLAGLPRRAPRGA